MKAFDPAFDSDADTEGPASGSSIWRRDFSRIMSNSSGGVQSDGGGTDVEAVAAAVGVEKLRMDSMDGRSMSNESGGGMTGRGVFARERACSFYGEGGGEQVGDQGDDIGPVTKAVLKDVLNEDYALYSAGVRGKGEDGVGADWDGGDGDGDTGRDGGDVGLEGDEGRRREKKEDGLGRAKSAPINVVREETQPKATKKARSFQWLGEEIRLRMDSGSGLGSDEIGTIGREVEMLLESLEKQRLCSVGVPLFVEEVGRIPRAAIVEGRMKKVKVCEEEGGGRGERRGGICGILTCFEGERSKRKRRKKKKAVENGEE